MTINKHHHRQNHKNNADEQIQRYQEMLNNRDCIIEEDARQKHNELHTNSSKVINTNQPARGWIPDLSNEKSRLFALQEAFKYRGDISITLMDNTTITGYVFDRRVENKPENSYIRVIPAGYPDKKIKIEYNRIAKLEFTGKDAAEGKSWKHYLKKQSEKAAD